MPGYRIVTTATRIPVPGRMRIEVDGEAVEIGAGQAIWTEPGARVRYSNPASEESEYFAVCIPDRKSVV
jgi:mannose-6-phosphate isomerase-like protein (cupin superfamily)